MGGMRGGPGDAMRFESRASWLASLVVARDEKREPSHMNMARVGFLAVSQETESAPNWALDNDNDNDNNGRASLWLGR